MWRKPRSSESTSLHGHTAGQADHRICRSDCGYSGAFQFTTRHPIRRIASPSFSARQNVCFLDACNLPAPAALAIFGLCAG